MTAGSLKPSSYVSERSEERLLIPQILQTIKWIPFYNQIVKKKYQITFFFYEMHRNYLTIICNIPDKLTEMWIH